MRSEWFALQTKWANLWELLWIWLSLRLTETRSFLPPSWQRCSFVLHRPFDVTDDSNVTSRVSRHLHPLRFTVPSKFSATSASSPLTYARPMPPASPSPAAATPASPGPPTLSAPAKPPVIHFKALFCGLTVGASLLPSLKAKYQVHNWHCFVFLLVFWKTDEMEQTKVLIIESVWLVSVSQSAITHASLFVLKQNQ